MKLNEICEVYSGYALKEFNDVEDGLPVIKIGNICIDGTLNLEECQYTTEGVDKKYYSNRGDVYIALSGATTGKVGIMDTNDTYVINQRVGIVRQKTDDIPQEYIKYFLLRQNDRIFKEAAGCAQPNISPKQIAEYIVPDISKDKMHERCAILNKIKNIIDGRNAEISALDNLIKARFVEMFGMPGTDAFGWGLVRLGSACNVNPKKSLDSRLVSGAEVSFVPMPAVTEHGEIDATAIKEYDEVKTGFTYFAEKDVLFAKITPCMENGKGAVAKGLHNGVGFGSTEFHVLRPISGKTDPYWIYTLTAFPQFRMDAANNMTGSAGQRRVPASFLENYRVSLPPIALQNQFAAFVRQVDKSKVAVKKALDETQLLFDSLMQKYFG